jgi:hypothetical protein
MSRSHVEMDCGLRGNVGGPAAAGCSLIPHTPNPMVNKRNTVVVGLFKKCHHRAGTERVRGGEVSMCRSTFTGTALTAREVRRRRRNCPGLREAWRLYRRRPCPLPLARTEIALALFGARPAADRSYRVPSPHSPRALSVSITRSLPASDWASACRFRPTLVPASASSTADIQRRISASRRLTARRAGSQSTTNRIMSGCHSVSALTSSGSGGSGALPAFFAGKELDGISGFWLQVWFWLILFRSTVVAD